MEHPNTWIMGPSVVVNPSYQGWYHPLTQTTTKKPDFEDFTKPTNIYETETTKSNS